MVTGFLMLEILVGLSERAEMVSSVVLGQPCRQPGQGSGLAWPGSQGCGVTAPKTLPAVVGPGVDAL